MRKASILVLTLVFLVACAPRYSDLSISERETNKVIDKFALQMQKRGMYPIGFGGSENEGKTTVISLTFQIDEVCDIDAVRKVLVGTTLGFLDCINSTPALRDYLCVYPFTPKQVEIIIVPKSPDRRDTPYISIAGAYAGTIRYKTDHPDPDNLQLITLKQETFEEAVEILKSPRGA